MSPEIGLVPKIETGDPRFTASDGIRVDPDWGYSINYGYYGSWDRGIPVLDGEGAASSPPSRSSCSGAVSVDANSPTSSGSDARRSPPSSSRTSATSMRATHTTGSPPVG